MSTNKSKVINFHRASFDISRIKSLKLSKEPKQNYAVTSTLTIECMGRAEYIFNPFSQSNELEIINDTIELNFSKWDEANNALIELQQIWQYYLEEV